MGVLVYNNADLGWGGWIGKSTGGEYAAVLCEQFAGDGIVAYIDIFGTPTKIGATQTSAIIFGSGNVVNRVAAVIDSNNVIHVVSITSGDRTRDIAYNTISNIDGTPAWGTWEEVQAHDVVAGMLDWHVDITVDSNDIPHVLHTQFTTIHGTSYLGVYYTNRIGGTWALSVDDPMSSPQANYSIPKISIKASDELEAMFYGRDDGDQYYNNTSGGSWGTQSSYADSNARTGNQSMLIAVGGTVYRIHHAGGNIKEDGVDTTYNTLSSGDPYVEGGSFIEPSDRYIFYVDAISDDIHLIKNTGSGWVDVGVVVTGTFEGCIVGWQYLNHNPVDEILFLYEDDSFDVYCETYSLAEVTRRIFITHV